MRSSTGSGGVRRLTGSGGRGRAVGSQMSIHWYGLTLMTIPHWPTEVYTAFSPCRLASVFRMLAVSTFTICTRSRCLSSLESNGATSASGRVFEPAVTVPPATALTLLRA